MATNRNKALGADNVKAFGTKKQNDIIDYLLLTVEALSDGNLETDYITLTAGTVTNPSLAFEDANMGFYKKAGAELGVTIAGVDTVIFSNNTDGLQINNIVERSLDNGVTIEQVILRDGKVSPIVSSATQLTNINTPVICNGQSVLITTVSATNAAGVTETFTLANNFIIAGRPIIVSINNYGGAWVTNGIPVVTVDIPAGDGSVNISITNIHPTNALNGSITFSLATF